MSISIYALVGLVSWFVNILSLKLISEATQEFHFAVGILLYISSFIIPGFLISYFGVCV